MIFVFGPAYSGKQEYICSKLGWSAEDFAGKAVRDAQELVRESCDIKALAKTLSMKEVVCADEVGCGIVPADPDDVAYRERAGRLCCLLSENADTVVRVRCGIPQVLKGEL